MAASYRNVFITGCNRGIGLEFIKQFLSLPEPPSHLFATCRFVQHENATELRNLAKENSNLHLLSLDVTKQDHIRNVACEVGKILQDDGLHLLINNAGITANVTLEDVTADQMMEAFQTNAVGPLMIAQALLPFLKQAGKASERAVIVNISARTASITENTLGKLYPSRASKAALNIINKSMSIDLKDSFITAVVVNPGWVKTPNGGPNALITTQESVSGMMEVIASLNLSKTGMFLDYRPGEILPW